MDLKLLNCFEVAASELHFGRAARRLDMMPSALGRNIRLLEEELGARLFMRSTRNVALTRSGHELLKQVPALLAGFEAAIAQVRAVSDGRERVFRIGAIDSAATGLIPQLMHDFRALIPEAEIILVEDKTARMLPKMINGGLDVAFVRPPRMVRPQLHFEPLLHEPTLVVLPLRHPLAQHSQIRIEDLADVPMIVPSPRNRPHSYDLTMRLFRNVGLDPKIAQQADEKQTIVNLVATGIGAALVPYWTSRIGVGGVVYKPLVGADGCIVRELPLAVAWVAGSKDVLRDMLMELLHANLDQYSR